MRLAPRAQIPATQNRSAADAARTTEEWTKILIQALEDVLQAESGTMRNTEHTNSQVLPYHQYDRFMYD
jgi:hypothetical protein